MIKKFIKITIFSCFLLLSNCSRPEIGGNAAINPYQKFVTGYHFKDRDLTKVEVGKSTVNDVALIMGSPTFIFNQKGARWYYASEDSFSIFFIRKGVKSRLILAHYFDENGILFDIKQYNLKSGNDFSMASIQIDLDRPNGFWSLPFYQLI